MRSYCTLFDSKFLTRGLALYESLIKHSSVPFRLYVLAMDKACAIELRSRIREDSQFSVISLKEYIASSPYPMAEIQKTRTWQEWAWTCGSNFTEFVKTYFALDEVTYCDADLFFFSDPEQIFAEISARSIAIIPHRFQGPKIAQNGKFNVSWVTFRGEIGSRCLSRWAAQCRDWCFYRNEPGRFGDQKYLDEWESLYGDEVCVIQNIGAGTAPWNLQQYRVTEGPKVNGVPIVFYHFHELALKPDGSVSRLTNYNLRPEDRELTYAPYLEALSK